METFEQYERLNYITHKKKYYGKAILGQTDSTLTLTNYPDSITILKSDILSIQKYRFKTSEMLEETCAWLVVIGIIGVTGLPFAIINGAFLGWLVIEGIFFGALLPPKLISNAKINYNLKHKWRIVYNNPNVTPDTFKNNITHL